MRVARLALLMLVAIGLSLHCGPPQKKGPTKDELKQQADEAYQPAEMYYKRGDLASLNKAADLYGKVLKIYPSLSEVHIKRGETFKKLSYYERSIEEFKAALKADPACGKCYYFLAHLTLAMAKPEEARVAQETALKDLQAAEKILPDDPEINMGMSDVFASMALYERMQAGSRNAQVKEFEDLSYQQAEIAFSKDSTAFEALRAMGEIYEMRGQKSQALQIYQQYIDALPEEDENRRDMQIHMDEMLGKR